MLISAHRLAFIFLFWTLVFQHAIVAGNSKRAIFVKDGEFVERYLHFKGAERFGIYIYAQSAKTFVRFAKTYRGCNPQISPKGTYVLFWGTNKGDVALFDSKKGWSQQLKLQLFTPDGKKVKSFDLPVGGIAWSPDEDKVAYTETKYAEMATPLNNNIWILDLMTGKRTRIPEKGSYVRWYRFDNQIYFLSSDSRKVVRYNPRDKKIEETSFKGVDFSSGGDYYIDNSHESNAIKIYLTNNNEEITERVITAMRRELGNAPINWSSAEWDVSDNLILSDLDLKRQFIFNLKNMHVTQIAGLYLGVIDSTTKEAAIVEHGQIKINRAE